MKFAYYFSSSRTADCILCSFVGVREVLCKHREDLMIRETHGVAPSCLGEVADRCLREVHVMEHTLFIEVHVMEHTLY